MGGSKISPSTHTPSSAGTLPPAPPGADACPLLSRFKEAIRRIKEQKQRPGFDRMLQTLKTHHEVHDAKEVRRQLELAVSTGLLLTVYTKGLQCYKDPDSLLGLRRFKIDTVNTRSRVQRAVKAAVREIGDPEGSSPEEIENYVRLSFT
ncbi:histone acetyltransferase KAT6A-like [Paramacrobiotus metropolitanus]|uniref:histone acetyltransferase KAT6A-like n=1 Tax=Paramacrobiotus metropolitanus TaxID=2943436 RepID=UPI002445E2E2|nr:histone acetyltransferase KAT6A-like [Paramacrobiotus metropolitanus]